MAMATPNDQRGHFLVVTIILGAVLSSGQADDPYTVNTLCADTYCLEMYYLYEGVSWGQAGIFCGGLDMMLVPVTTAEIQQKVQDIIRPVAESERQLNGAWIAGLQSESTKWVILSGEDATVTGVDFSSTHNCLAAANPSSDYIDQACGTPDDSTGALCETPVLADGSCPQGYQHSIQYCYRVYTATGGMSWYTARSQCLQDGGDLIWRDLDRLTHILEFLSSGASKVWIGVRRRNWQWNVKDGYVQMEYYNFEPYTDDKAGQCAYVDHTKSYKWERQPCLMTKSSFVCFSGTLPQTTTTTIATVTYTDSDTTEESSTLVTPTADESTSDDKYGISLIVPVVIIGALVILVPIIIVGAMGKLKCDREYKHQPYNTHITPSNQGTLRSDLPDITILPHDGPGNIGQQDFRYYSNDNINSY